MTVGWYPSLDAVITDISITWYFFHKGLMAVAPQTQDLIPCLKQWYQRVEWYFFISSQMILRSWLSCKDKELVMIDVLSAILKGNIRDLQKDTSRSHSCDILNLCYPEKEFLQLNVSFLSLVKHWQIIHFWSTLRFTVFTTERDFTTESDCTKSLDCLP